MTYRELLEELSSLSDEQLDCTVTVEVELADECYPAEWRISGDEHPSLDPDHPIIYVS